MRGRTSITTALAGLALAASPATVWGQDLSPELQAFDEQLPGSLINDPTDLVWQTQGPLDVEGVQDESIPGGGAARRYEISSKGANPWSSQAYVPLLTDIARGDVVTVGFYARTVSAETADGKGMIGVRFQENAAPYSGFADTTVSVGSEWEWYEVSGTATTGIKQEVATVVLQMAGAKQTLEIGQTIVVKGVPSILGAPAAEAPAAEPEPTEEPEIPEPLLGAGTLLNRPEMRNWQVTATVGSYEDRDEPTIWLGRATRFTADARGENDWDLVANIPIEQALSEGDKLLVAITARTVSAQTPDGKAYVALRLQDSAPPYEAFSQNAFKAGENWQLIRANATASRDFAAGTAQLSLHFAAEAQVVDIGPVYVFKVE